MMLNAKLKQVEQILYRSTRPHSKLGVEGAESTGGKARTSTVLYFGRTGRWR